VTLARWRSRAATLAVQLQRSARADGSTSLVIRDHLRALTFLPEHLAALGVPLPDDGHRAGKPAEWAAWLAPLLSDLGEAEALTLVALDRLIAPMLDGCARGAAATSSSERRILA